MLFALINMTLHEEHTWENYFLRRWDAIADARGRNKSFNYAVGHADHFPELHVKFHNPNTMQIPLPLVVLQDQATSYVDTLLAPVTCLIIHLPCNTVVSNVRYKFEGELSLAALKEWLGKWENGQLQPYRRTGGAVVRCSLPECLTCHQWIG